ncbi:hypothetical protein B0H11DRAFT_2163797 [Mycena galericulata]|nr:hypothetical protein B0H11DRAFT_2163797 [Mycena galericulata]
MTVGVTPHASYSSSIGVLGCKVDVNRIAYFPTTPDCNNMCLQVTHGAQTLNLLHIDQSGGAYDISYDAWNYLYTGKSATVAPVAGGAIDMQVTPVDMSHCLPILNGTNTAGKLPLSASNSMDYYANCVSEPSSWAASNMLLLNILDSQCHFGYDEICTIDLATSNQATCPHQLGLNTALTTEPVYNIQYSSGTLALA